MQANRGIVNSWKWIIIALIAVALLILGGLVVSRALANNNNDNNNVQFTKDLRLQDCKFQTQGKNPYFILEPGYQLLLEGKSGGKSARLVITVLNETQAINLPEIGSIETRVVEERETANDQPVETSRNFFAICDKTNDVYYFGEEVDIFKSDGTVNHAGAWRAGEPDKNGLAEPGIAMPGTFLLGSRYYQEIADGIALDRAEHTNMGLALTYPAVKLSDCVKVIETSPLESGKSVKLYCSGIGLVSDGELRLVKYGSNIVP